MRQKQPIKNAKGQTICGAKTRAGGQCQRFPIKGRTRCRLHGGTQKVGLDNPNAKQGRYSAYLPKSLAAGYEASRNDPELLALHDEIALIDSRTRELIGHLGSQESGALWIQLRRDWGQFRRAQARGDVATMGQLIGTLSGLIERGAAEAQAWSEIGDLIERRRRLALTEQRRQQSLQTTVTAESLDVLITHLTLAIRDNVSDPVALRNISQALGVVLGGGVEGK